MAEQINYLTQAFQIIANSEGNYGLGVGLIKDFMPKLLKHTQNELYRYNMSDIITMLQGYDALWETQILQKKDFATVHRTCHTYLENYLHRAKKLISGR